MTGEWAEDRITSLSTTHVFEFSEIFGLTTLAITNRVKKKRQKRKQ